LACKCLTLYGLNSTLLLVRPKEMAENGI
jgi:hypothetical protein